MKFLKSALLVGLIFLTQGTFSFAQDSQDISLANDPNEYIIVPYGRGQCTDTHSKEWCDNNGYKNNRPVAYPIKLTPKQADCYWTFIKKFGFTSIAVFVDPVGGALYGTEAAVEILDKCGN